MTRSPTSYITNRPLTVGLGLLGLGLGLGLAMSSRRRSRNDGAAESHATVADVSAVITVNRPAAEVLDAWSRFEPFAIADILERREGEGMMWRSKRNSTVETLGHVDLTRAPGGRGTEVRVHLQHTSSSGSIIRAFQRVFGTDPQSVLQENLRRFKQLVETGEVTLSDGPSLWRAARPAEQAAIVRTHAEVK
ncbi:MAG: hypothetical protein M3R55_04745 [Acidobacteriota bacterium]|nr:hypothetical protein [Acidobacteriota bacterium]